MADTVFGDVQPRTGPASNAIDAETEDVLEEQKEVTDQGAVDPYDSFITLEPSDYRPPLSLQGGLLQGLENTNNNGNVVPYSSISGVEPGQNFFYTTIFHNNFGKFSKVTEYYPRREEGRRSDRVLFNLSTAPPRFHVAAGPHARPTYTVMTLPGQSPQPIIYYSATN